MKTQSKIFFKNSTKMDEITTRSVDLMVTSPPYPMIEMWDDIFCKQNPAVKKALRAGDGLSAFELMHKILDPIWKEVYRILKFGGFACINVGDATRTLNGNFALYPNHMRILKYMLTLGFSALPCILWRKQTNAPNKFMGSGMLPAGAYITLEHEYILILRKGPKREFQKEEDKRRRRESAIFWEERNDWYSDVWFDIKGTQQKINNRKARQRSAAYPFELVYRLINMYSAKGDLVLDPFLGTGTTMAASIAAGRNFIGYELDQTLRDEIYLCLNNIIDDANERIFDRLKDHLIFVKKRKEINKPIKHLNIYYKFPVVTSQERDLLLNTLLSFQETQSGLFEAVYSDEPQKCFIFDNSDIEDFEASAKLERCSPRSKMNSGNLSGSNTQLSLFQQF